MTADPLAAGERTTAERRHGNYRRVEASGSPHEMRRRMTNVERRQQIVHVAAERFDESGYSNTTLDDIAQAVGVAKPTLYHYFESKDEILYSIHDEFIDLLLRRHEQRVGAGLGPEQLLLEVMADILELMETHRGHVRVFFEHHRELSPDARARIWIKRQHYEHMVQQAFEDGVAAGVFRQVDARLATLGIFGMVNWAHKWYSAEDGLSSRDIACQFWNFLVHGLGKS
jgi:AcrR family transcriptional regulator